MTKQEFGKAVEIAHSDENLSQIDDSIFLGCGLPEFEPVTVTIRQVAKFVRWQALQFNGEFDAFALDACANVSRRNFLIA